MNKKPHQAELEGAGIESLPLFSSTPMREPEPSKPKPRASPRQSTFADCPICLDTGRVKDGRRRLFCWCAAGDRVRLEMREENATTIVTAIRQTTPRQTTSTDLLPGDVHL